MFTRWLATEKGYSAHTVSGYQRDLREFYSHVDGRSEHGDIVKRDVDGRVVGNLLEVGVDACRAQSVVERRDDRDRPRPQTIIMLARQDRLA